MILYLLQQQKKLILPARLDYASVRLLENTGRISESVSSRLLFIEQQLCSGRSRSKLRFFSECVGVTVGSVTQKVKSDVAADCLFSIQEKNLRRDYQVMTI